MAILIFQGLFFLYFHKSINADIRSYISEFLLKILSV